jgi:hypothetical protein
MERFKHRSYSHLRKYQYFWREYNGKEVDLVEEGAGKIEMYEFKWNKAKAGKSNSVLSSYPDAKLRVINKENCWAFIS